MNLEAFRLLDEKRDKMFHWLQKFYIDRCVKAPVLRKCRKKQFINLRDAKSVVLLYEADRVRNDKLMQLIHEIGSLNIVQAWGYTTQNDFAERETINIHHIKPKDINFLGKPVPSIEERYLSDTFDILIDLTMQEVIPLKYMLGISRSNCRCGYVKEGYEGLYDLEVSRMSGKKEEDLLKQILFYLTTIQTKL